MEAMNEAAQVGSTPEPPILNKPVRASLAKRKSPAQLTDASRLVIINMYSEQEGSKKKHKQADIARLVGVSPAVVNKIVHNKENLLQYGMSDTIRHREGLLGADIENALVQRIVDVNHNGGVVTGFLLESWAKDIAKVRFPNFKGSRGWHEGFMRRHELQYMVLHGEAASVPENIVESGRAAMRQITNGWDLVDVFNADETGLFYQILGSRSIVSNPRAGTKLSKARMTILACANATGSVKLPLLVINKFETPRSLRSLDKANLPVQWRANHSTWMTQVIWSQWLKDWDATLERSTLLLIDNCLAHNVPDDVRATLQHLTIKFLPKNMTSHLQPLDQGVLSAFKRRYRSGLVKWFVDTLDNIRVLNLAMRDKQAALQPKEYDAIKLMAKAWDEITPVAIANCWRKAGIVSNPEPTLEITEMAVEDEAAIAAFLSLCLNASDLPYDLKTVVQDGDPDVDVFLGGIPDEHQVIEVPTDAEWVITTMSALATVKETVQDNEPDIRLPSINPDLPTIDDALRGIDTVLGFAKRPGMLTGKRLDDAKALKSVLEQLKDVLNQ